MVQYEVEKKNLNFDKLRRIGTSSRSRKPEIWSMSEFGEDCGIILSSCRRREAVLASSIRFDRDSLISIEACPAWIHPGSSQ